MSESINLISTKRETARFMPVKRLYLMRAVAVGLLFIVSVSAIIVFILVALSPLPELRRQEQSLRFTLSQSHTVMGKLDLLSERTGAIGTIFQQRKSFDTLIQTVQDALPVDVTVDSVRMDKEGITLSASSKSLQSIDTFINGLIKYVGDKKAFSEVKMTDLTTDSTKTTYDVTLQLVMIQNE